MDDSDGEQHTFIIRTWLEPRARRWGGPEWRGMIEHVGTGDRRYFRTGRQIIDYLDVHLKGFARQHRLSAWVERRRRQA